MELAEEIGRLADAVERTLERNRRLDRERRAAVLLERWGPTVTPPPPVGIGTFLAAIPGLAAHFDRTVPSEFVAQTDERQMVVACPCGQEPTVIHGELTSCECGRWFLHDGQDVHVARFDTTAPSEPSTLSDDAQPAPTGP